MENISRGHTFGDFVTIFTKASMQDVTVARGTEYLQEYRLPSPFSFKCNVLHESLSVDTGQSKYSLRNNEEKGGRGLVGNLCISLNISDYCRAMHIGKAPNHQVSGSDLLLHFRILHSVKGCTLQGMSKRVLGLALRLPPLNTVEQKTREIKLPIFLLLVEFTNT
jgi:hypothetical protein